jgi:alkaline phosphatase D
MRYVDQAFQAGQSRRKFLATTTSLAAAAVWSMRAEGVVKANLRFADDPFAIGVTSGDPTSDGFVLWTRLAPKPIEGGGMPHEAVAVSWQVADDEAMTKIVQEGTTTATPDWGHSVHVEVTGLKPDRWYWYRFKTGNAVSPVGRARTFPAAGVLSQKLRFAFASCQHYEQGLYTAYGEMARDDLDVVLHLGDYIYEYAGKDKLVRKHTGLEIDSVDDYRNRHALYKTDHLLAEVHRLFPWVVTWDDHEFDNNCANDISEEPGVQREAFLARRARSYQAYYEHMPLRRAALPKGPDMLLYRRVSFGDLAEFFVLDTRQYRTDQPCGDGNKQACLEVYSEQATLTGAAQEQWLLDGFGQSRARWNVLAQQVMMARVDRAPGDVQAFSMDQWPGYEQNRRRVLKAFARRPEANPLVLTGDIHSHWANNLIADFDDLESKVVGTEFVGTSISSGGNGVAKPKTLEATYSENPFVKYHAQQRGYVRCEATPERCRADFKIVDFVEKPGGAVTTGASFVVENGQPGLQRV